MDLHVKSVKVICAEGRDQNAAHLVIIASNLQFFGCAPDRQVVDDDLALVKSALGYASQFSELKIAQVLDANPDTNAKHGKQRPRELPVGHSRNKLSMAKMAETP